MMLLDGPYIDFKNKFTSFTSAVPGEGTVFINSGAAVYKGLEGQATYAFTSGIAVFANGSLNYAKTNNPGAAKLTLANAPKWTAAGGVIVKHGPIRFSLIDKYTGTQYFTDDNNPVYRSKGYNTALLAARYDFGRIRVGVEVNDLFNSTAVTNISKGSAYTDATTKQVSQPYDQYFYQPGRSVTGDITITF